MKLFCECNGDWKTQWEFEQRQVCMDDIQLNPSHPCTNECGHCGFYPWYDADYENMMFDLRSMNS